MRKAVVAGHICLDITPLFPPSLSGKGVGEYLSPGKLVQTGEADIHTGGVVSNTGLGMRILGADVNLMAKVGNDPFGKMITDILNGYSVKCDLSVSDTPTSYSIVIAPPGIDRMFLHNPGANDTFSAEDLDMGVIEDSTLFHFGYPPIMRKMYENRGAELVKIFRTVKEKNVITSLDMASVDPDSDAGRADWEGILAAVLPYVDFFFPSIEELLYMLNRKRYNEINIIGDNGKPEKPLDIEADVIPLAERLLEMGTKGVIIKCGAPGLYYRMGDSKKLETLNQILEFDLSGWGNRSGFADSFETKVVSATGAGDTTIAAFLTAFLEGRDLDECLTLAVATGSCCVEACDALSGLESFDELKKRISGGWEKIRIN